MAEKKGAKASSEGASAKGAGTGPAATADLLKKITPVTVMGEKVAKLAPGEGEEPVELFTVFGIGNGTKTGDTQYGAWEAMTGVFEAVRSTDGKRFQSAVCFLPGAAGEILLGSLKAAQEKDPDASVHFAVVISVRFMERRDGTAGYEFVTREVVKPAQADLLADLRTKALGLDK